MNIIIVSKNGQNAKSFSLSLLFVLIISSIVLLSSLFYIYISQQTTIPLQSNTHLQSNNNLAVLKTIKEQKLEIKNLQDEINSLQVKAIHQQETTVLKLAQMQSKLIFLDDLGSKIVKVTNLNPKEFNFDQPLSIGGPSATENNEQIDIEQRFSEITKELQVKSHQLSAIKALYDEKFYKDAVTPTGRPAEKSWISSYFGKRKDPFTGKKTQHRGIDIAAKANSKVLATASGIVSWASNRTGYGNLVEIKHGNGMVTRYGHCKKILVSVGQKINQGDKIATIGSTGRSTGPHIHYEVLHNGIKINPLKYVRNKRNPSLANM